jgi:hypothetical protein
MRLEHLLYELKMKPATLGRLLNAGLPIKNGQFDLGEVRAWLAAHGDSAAERAQPSDPTTIREWSRASGRPSRLRHSIQSPRASQGLPPQHA